MTLLQRLHSSMQADRLNVRFDSDRLTMEYSCGVMTVPFSIINFSNTILLHACLPISVPIYRRAELAEAINRANWNLVTGNFEMDYDTGQMRFKAFFPVVEEEDACSKVRRIIYEMCINVESYAPALLELVCTDHKPDVAIARIEGRPNWAITDDDIPF